MVEAELLVSRPLPLLLFPQVKLLKFLEGIDCTWMRTAKGLLHLADGRRWQQLLKKHIVLSNEQHEVLSFPSIYAKMFFSAFFMPIVFFSG